MPTITLDVKAEDFQVGDVIRLSAHVTVRVTGAPWRETARQISWPVERIDEHGNVIDYARGGITKRKGGVWSVRREVAGEVEQVVTGEVEGPWDTCPECGDFLAWCPKRPEFHHMRED